MGKQSGCVALNSAHLRYLLTIYHLSGKKPVQSKDIAACLLVNKASVSKMLGILVEKDLVVKARYGQVSLTELGQRMASRSANEVDRLSALLRREMDLLEGEAWSAACAAICAISGRFSKLGQ